MNYLLLLIVFFIVETVYFKIADKYNIIDKPNERSSHSVITIRGGGVLFPLAALLWFLLNDFNYPYMVSGLLLLAMVSFVDDIKPQSKSVRLSVQIIAVSLLLFQLGLFQIVHPVAIAVIYVLLVGFTNAVNFMDGINGITSLYALSALGAFLYLNQNLAFTNESLLVYIILGVLVFTFFNFRKKAKCFAGDVGSVSIAFLLSFFIIQLILATGNWNYMSFFAIYGADTILTIFQRLFNKENIFDAHRSHLYQYLANEMKFGHLKVSSAYFILQLLINAVVIYWVEVLNNNSILPFIVIISLLILIYIALKSIILHKIKRQKRL